MRLENCIVKQSDRNLQILCLEKEEQNLKSLKLLSNNENEEDINIFTSLNCELTLP